MPSGWYQDSEAKGSCKQIDIGTYSGEWKKTNKAGSPIPDGSYIKAYDADDSRWELDGDERVVPVGHTVSAGSQHRSILGDTTNYNTIFRNSKRYFYDYSEKHSCPKGYFCKPDKTNEEKDLPQKIPVGKLPNKSGGGSSSSVDCPVDNFCPGTDHFCKRSGGITTISSNFSDCDLADTKHACPENSGTWGSASNTSVQQTNQNEITDCKGNAGWYLKNDKRIHTDYDDKNKREYTKTLAGNYSVQGSDDQSSARAGWHVASDGASKEIQCTKGNYSNNGLNNTGSTACTAASAGWHVDSDGASQEIKCTKGNYSNNGLNNTGSTACTAASAGYKVDSDGASQQIKCTKGNYSNNGHNQTGSTACTAASAGYYVGSDGASRQLACGRWKYQGSTGQSSCSTCTWDDSDSHKLPHKGNSIATTAATACKNVSGCGPGEASYTCTMGRTDHCGSPSCAKVGDAKCHGYGSGDACDWGFLGFASAWDEWCGYWTRSWKLKRCWKDGDIIYKTDGAKGSCSAGCKHHYDRIY